VTDRPDPAHVQQVARAVEARIATRSGHGAPAGAQAAPGVAGWVGIGADVATFVGQMLGRLHGNAGDLALLPDLVKFAVEEYAKFDGQSAAGSSGAGGGYPA
jgi:hypothetical protein